MSSHGVNSGSDDVVLNVKRKVNQLIYKPHVYSIRIVKIITIGMTLEVETEKRQSRKFTLVLNPSIIVEY